MSKRRGIIIVLLLFAIIVVVGFAMRDQNDVSAEPNVSAEESTEPNTMSSEALAEIERAEKEKREAEEKAIAEAEAIEAQRIRDEMIQAFTYFVIPGGTTVYKESDSSSEQVGKLTGKSAIFVEEMIEDDAGKIVFMKIKDSIDDNETLGFISAQAVEKTLEPFIAKKYDDVDYTPFQKNDRSAYGPSDGVKAIFVTGHSAQGSKMDELITLIEETQLNAVVIDVKDDIGHLLFKSEAAALYNPAAYEHYYIEDMEAFVDKLKAKDIYMIARIVTFKSPIYAKSHPERAIVYKSNNALYSDRDRLIWASPHDRVLWDYNIAVAKEAAEYGFDEIQFDYVRFPAIANRNAMDYRNEHGESPTAAIQSFLKTAYQALDAYEVAISADVFGWAASATDDVGIGQHWEAISNVVDVISPMMYPSHYGPGNFGLSVPDAFPYETIDRSVKEALERNRNLQTPGRIRPWIQDFTATWVKGYIRYGAKEVRAQIDALEANGITEYLLWNAGNFYSRNAFK